MSSSDESSIVLCVKQLQSYLPNEDAYKIRAAVDIRLRRFEELKEIFDLDESCGRMYGILISRAIELGDGVVVCM